MLFVLLHFGYGGTDARTTALILLLNNVYSKCRNVEEVEMIVMHLIQLFRNRNRTP
jgi:hypothetical protein